MKDVLSNWGRAYAAGMAGATALTAVHQVARRVFEDAPRMDVVGERGIARGVEAAGGTPPEGPSLHRLALAGDLFANSAYYSLVACGSRAHVWRRGVVLGLAAGAGALALPRHMGLGDPPRSDRMANQIMTVAWYLVGGLAAAAFAARVSDPQQDAPHPAAA
ncbi:MAG TPA: hypothetical protein VE379_03195 [Vicinamibacterales bacterium]|jgi:hypothetical protein|nr:hypothetical protein [Vicinamibacterales bacterium]